jgi:hypothetical protein
MNVQIVMDHYGDTRHEFDPKNAEDVLRAEDQFRQLSNKGFRAVALGKDGKPATLLREFDVEAEQTLFIPQLQGG